MSIAPSTIALSTAISLDSVRHRVVSGLHQRARSVRNEAAPLILVAVIAVAAAVALILLIGVAAAWLYFCQSSFGPRYWPTVGVPTRGAAYYYFSCRRV